MTRTLSGIVLPALALACAPEFAQAQSNSALPTAESGREYTVAARPRPEYEPIPIRIGSFNALPQISAGVEFNDNIYASSSATRADAIATVDPQISIKSDWARHSIEGYVRAIARHYAKFSAESTTDYQAGASGRLDSIIGQLEVSADFGRATEPRASPDSFRSSARPIQFNQANLQIKASKEFSRTKLTFQSTVSKFDFHNGVDTAGGVVLEDDRDRTVYINRVQSEYAVSPRLSFYLNGSVNNHVYDYTAKKLLTDRNSSGGELDAGFKYELTSLIEVDMQGGYLTQTFSDSRNRPVSGFGGRASIVWLATGLTNVTLTGARAIQDSDAAGAAVFVSNAATLQVDHELLRNLILTARAGYEVDKYNGINREDRGGTAYVGGRYLMNRLTSLNLGYNFQSLRSTSSNAGPQYSVSRLTAAVMLRF